jgi:polar amino acid transport system substrate-binding protein
MKIIGKLITLIVVLTSFDASADEPLRVAIIDHTPFVMNANTKPLGMAIDIWQKIADKLKWNYRFIPQNQGLNQAIDDLREGKFDVLVGAIPVDKRGLRKIEFSRPYFINKIGLVVNDDNLGFWYYFSGLFNKIFANTFLIILCIYLAFIHLIWYLEKGISLPNKYVKGVMMSSWFALTSIIYQDWEMESFSKEKQPKTLGHFASRVAVTFWVIASTTVLATLLATIISSLTMSLVTEKKHYVLSEFEHKKVAIIQDADTLLAINFDMTPVKVTSFDKALELLKTNQVAAIIEDYPMANYYMKYRGKDKILLTGITLGYSEYAIAFKPNTKLKNQFDIALEKLKQKKALLSICASYVGKKTALFCDL